MTNVSSNNKRIAKNTLLLYFRMLLIMVVSLYTSRVILEALGVEDFGLYNVVGGIIVLFTFVNNAMVTSTQRFLSFEIGRKNMQQARHVFSACINIHLIIILITILLAETIGLWFLNESINVPQGRETAMNWVYQLTILTTCLNMIRMPFNAAIIAYEKMSFYAYVSIVEVLLKLGIVFMILWSPYDRLIYYAFLTLLVSLIIFILYLIYCRYHFTLCRYVMIKDINLYKSLVSFSGWSLFGGLANMGASQGLNILMNIFCGVTVNAAMGIANQVNAAVYSFVANFQTAFNPQIVKSYASGDRSYFINLIISTSKYSYYLLFTLSLPLYICCSECLNLWLTEVPEYTVSFCRLMIIFSLLDAIQGPLWVSVQATGKIKNYQILMSLMILMNLPMSYCCLQLGMQPEIVLVVKVIINALIFIVRLWYLERLYDFPVFQYIKEVIYPICVITIVSYSLSTLLSADYDNAIYVLIQTIVFSLLCNFLLIYFIGLNINERAFIKIQINKYI